MASKLAIYCGVFDKDRGPLRGLTHEWNRSNQPHSGMLFVYAGGWALWTSPGPTRYMWRVYEDSRAEE